MPTTHPQISCIAYKPTYVLVAPSSNFQCVLNPDTTLLQALRTVALHDHVCFLHETCKRRSIVRNVEVKVNRFLSLHEA